MTGSNAEPAPGPEEARLVFLDGLRGAAVIMVIAWHYFANPFIDSVSFLPWSLEYIVTSPLALLWTGVDLFFVLSGFLLTRILLKQRRAKSYYATFYFRRACRIFPLYYLLLASYLFFKWQVAIFQPRGEEWLFQNPMPFLSYASFTQNFFMTELGSRGANFLAITWSLAIEEQFYILLPLAIRIVSPRFFPGFCILGVLSAPLFRFILWHQTEVFASTTNLLFCRMDGLLLGGLAAWLLQSDRWRVKLQEHVRFLWSACAFFGSMIFLYSLTRDTLPPGFVVVWAISLLSIFFALLLVILCVSGSSSRIVAVFSHPVLTKVAPYSYSLYIFHQMVWGLLSLAVFQASPVERYSLLLTISALGLSICLSVALYRWIELPFLRLGQKMRYERCESHPLPPEFAGNFSYGSTAPSSFDFASIGRIPEGSAPNIDRLLFVGEKNGGKDVLKEG